MRKIFSSILMATLLLSGCGSSTAEDSSPQNTDIDVVIDVRTTIEYAAGHVEGALNLDVESGALESSLSSLDKQSTYVVYCRSGRRSAIAADLMRLEGFEVIDGGSLDNMVSLGWPIGQ